MSIGPKMSRHSPGTVSMRTVWRCMAILGYGMIKIVYKDKVMSVRNQKVSQIGNNLCVMQSISL